MERDIVKRIEDLMDLFDEGEVTTADQTQKPEDPYRDFNERNPLAGGGRIGFNNGSKSLVQNKPYKSVKNHSSFQKITLGKRKGKYRLILGSRKNKKTYYGTIKQLQKIFDKEAFKNIGNLKARGTGTLGGDTRPKDLENKKYSKNYLPRNKFLKFLKSKGIDIKRPDVFAKNYGIDIKPNPYFKGDSIYNISKLNNQSFVDNIITRQVRAGKGTDKQKIKFRKGDEGTLATQKKRKKSLSETDPTKAKGTKKFNYHHIRQIAGGVPLTTDDVVIINQRLNSQLQDYDKTLNRISTAIRKNNRLALEAMNDKQEGLALEYMKRSDDLNAQAEKIVNSAIDKLPKKYKGYVGFNKFTLPRDEYGLPISNEPMLIKKVGGMPVSKDAIDLTDLNLKQEAKFRKIVKAQAEKGQTGPIKNINNILSELAANIDPDGCGRKKGATGGRVGLKFGSTECAAKAKNYLNQVVDRGIQNEPPARVGLIKKILSGTGNFVKQSLSPRELFKLENLVGKPALYATAAIESGLLADDVLRKKEPINVAAAENFLVGNLLNLDADAERAKNIINDPDLSPAAKTYAQGIIDQDNFRKLSQTYATNLVKNPLFIPSGAKAKADTALANLKNKITNTPETGRMDYESLLADKQDAFTAKEKPFDAPDKPGLPSFTSGQLEKRNVPGEFVIDPSFPLPLQRETLVPSYVSPSYSPERPEYEKDEFINKYLKSIGEEPLRPGEGTLFRMNTPELGLFGTQERFARGGIAGLSGGDKSGPPPVRGPNPQGLPSLLKRVRNL